MSRLFSRTVVIWVFVLGMCALTELVALLSYYKLPRLERPTWITWISMCGWLLCPPFWVRQLLSRTTPETRPAALTAAFRITLFVYPPVLNALYLLARYTS